MATSTGTACAAHSPSSGSSSGWLMRNAVALVRVYTRESDVKTGLDQDVELIAK